MRFDGGHKTRPLPHRRPRQWCEWVSVCPEVEIGLGTPRPTIGLEGSAGVPRLVEPKSGDDLTELMTSYSEKNDRVADP